MISKLPAWETVRMLAPTQSAGVEFVERQVRGERWLFMHNEITGQHVRVSELTRHVVQQLNGHDTVQQLVARISSDTSDIEKDLLATHLVMLIQLGIVSIESELSDQLLQQRANHILQQKKPPWYNPLAVKIPVLDPDRWLTRFNDQYGHWLNQRLLWILLSIVAMGIFIALLNKTAFVTAFGNLVSSPQQWWQIALIYPLLKCLHELSHALVIKRLQGSVHEAGLTILVLMPVPYVDATDIWRFKSRQERMLVSGAGMLAEGVVATIALVLWLAVEPGLLADLLFAIALTGSVTTLLFNANPLLKFDGYQMLQDALDIPNLSSRSSRYSLYLIKRYILGAVTVVNPVTGRGERPWLISYALASLLYRWVLTLSIALYLATRFPVLGGILAAYALYKLTVAPCVSAVRYLVSDGELRHCRYRSGVVSLSLICACLSIVFLLPVPTHTSAHGVVDVPSQAQLFSPNTGEIAEIYIEAGDTVEPGQPVLRIDAPDLEAQAKVLESELTVLGIEYQAALIRTPVTAASLLQDIIEKEAVLERSRQALQSLIVHSNVSGRVNLIERFAHVGAFVSEGEALGHVVSDADLLIKVVVTESDIARVEESVQAVHVRLAERFSDPIVGSLSHKMPAATRTLPSDALAAQVSHSGIAVASSAQQGLETVEPVYQLEVKMPSDTQAVGIGGRAYITLVHSSEPIGTRSWRALRRLVLEEFAI